METGETRQLLQALKDAMSGHHAHIDFDAAIDDFPPDLRGIRPPGAPHTPWQLLEHMRIAQWDILEFSRDAKHRSPKWPDGYWPKTEAPPSDEAWDKSVAAFRRDRAEMIVFLDEGSENLFKRFPHGDGQTALREVLLIANHNSYHLGQLVFLKKLLSAAA
ncbi:MAG: DinB family protein [Acidobacteriaceae bacterium]|nr:DinB family protein [Acidobacteriaceae bacterium]